MDEIHIDDIECPLCDSNEYCEAWDIAVEPDTVQRTHVTCPDCGGVFVVKTTIDITVETLS